VSSSPGEQSSVCVGYVGGEQSSFCRANNVLKCLLFLSTTTHPTGSQRHHRLRQAPGRPQEDQSHHRLHRAPGGGCCMGGCAPRCGWVWWGWLVACNGLNSPHPPNPPNPSTYPPHPNPQCDLALLTVADDTFWEGLRALTFVTETPELQSPVLVAGCVLLCCAVLCCAVLCCAVLCCAVLCLWVGWVGGWVWVGWG